MVSYSSQAPVVLDEAKDRRLISYTMVNKYIIAAILKVVLRGEGTKTANLTLRQIRQYLPLLLEYDFITETIYKITQKAILFLNLYDQLNGMM